VWQWHPRADRTGQPAQTPAARAELGALNFFKGPWDRPGPHSSAEFRPSGRSATLRSGTTKHDIDIWLGTLSEPDRKHALDPFTVIERRQKRGRLKWSRMHRHYKDDLTERLAHFAKQRRSPHERRSGTS